MAGCYHTNGTTCANCRSQWGDMQQHLTCRQCALCGVVYWGTHACLYGLGTRCRHGAPACCTAEGEPSQVPTLSQPCDHCMCIAISAFEHRSKRTHVECCMCGTRRLK